MHLCVYNCIHMCNGIFYRRYGYACPIHINAQTCILTYTYDHTDERTSPLLGLPKLKRNKEMQPVLFCKYVEKTCTYMRTVYKSMYDVILKNQYIYIWFIYIQPCCSGKPRQLAPINTQEFDSMLTIDGICQNLGTCINIQHVSQMHVPCTRYPYKRWSIMQPSNIQRQNISIPPH